MPALRFNPSGGATPVWQPLMAQLAVKMGCTAPENETLAVPQLHTPALHVCPSAQTTPQPPQLDASVCVLMHEPPHNDVPVGQTHIPLWQVSPAPQTIPQPPQSLESVAVLTHAPPQRVPPEGQTH